MARVRDLECLALRLVVFLGVLIGMVPAAQAVTGSRADAMSGNPFLERNGYIVIEMESVKPASGFVIEKDSKFAGFLGSGYYRATANSLGKAGTKTSFPIRITKAGKYRLELRSRRDEKVTDAANDVWVGVNGSAMAKLWLASHLPAAKWTWASQAEMSGHVATWQLEPGDHTIHFASRSAGYRIDRLVFYTTNGGSAKGDGTPESPRASGKAEPVPEPVPDPVPEPVVEPGPKPVPGGSAVVMKALEFPYSGTGWLKDGSWVKTALMVNPDASKQASVSKAFPGNSGTYDITLGAVGETDGRSRYKVSVGTRLLGEFVVPLASSGYPQGGEFSKTWSGVAVKKGDAIRIEGFAASADGKEWSRARWTQLAFAPTATTGLGRKAARNSDGFTEKLNHRNRTGVLLYPVSASNGGTSKVDVRGIRYVSQQ